MKIVLLLKLVILFSCISSILYSQPKLEFEGGDNHDFGEVLVENAPFLATIKIMNVGTEDLKIFDLEKDCGCTWVPLDKNLISPGDFALINIRQTFPVTGNVTKVLTFHTNDPDKPQSSFYIYAKVSSLSNVSSLLFDFGEIKIDETAKAVVVLKNTKEFDVRIIKIKNTNPSIELNIKDGANIPANSEIKIEATYKPHSIGHFNEPIYLLTNDKDMGKVMINTNCRVVPKTVSNK